MESGSSAQSQHDSDMSKLFTLAMSFFGGVLITVIALGFALGNTTSNGVGRQSGVPANSDQLAREVGEPSVQVEVAGAQCDASQRVLMDFESTPEDLLELWNETVLSPGDACTPAFVETLGSDWLLTHTTLSVLNGSGTIYEVATTGEVVSGLAIYLVPEDEAATADLHMLLANLWGEDNIAWGLTCDQTNQPWSGLEFTNGLLLEVVSCGVA